MCLLRPTNNVTKEVVWAISNLLAEDSGQIGRRLFVHVLKLAQVTTNVEIQHEVMWCILNMSSAGTDMEGLVDPILEQIHAHLKRRMDQKVTLDALKAVLEAGNQFGEGKCMY